MTKTVGPAEIETAYNLGVRHFGENRVQEAGEKDTALTHLKPRPAWHMIGHLQSNKVKPALELFDMIQSVDSPGLAESIDARARFLGLRVPVLLQINVSGETTKGGFSPDNIEDCFPKVRGLTNIDIKGLMTIAPLADDPEQARPVFRRLRELRDQLGLEHLSMGMTDDFETAIEEGATMIELAGQFLERENIAFHK